MSLMKELIEKYNVPGPRYTSYPTVPFWQDEGMPANGWKESVTHSFDLYHDDGISVYIHLPFCESLCTFCGCHKHITKQHGVEEPYIDAVISEWQQYVALFPKKPLLKELHLGGGTPTFFAPENLERLMNAILGACEVHSDVELGFEGHPNNTTEEHLRTLYGFGFRRVSFGVQDYDPIVQKTINRIQPFETVQEAHYLARKMGYDSISHDLVFGLPKQTMDNILETVRLTNMLKPDRISLYSYAHVPWIKGVGQRGFDESDLPSAFKKRAMYDAAKTRLLDSGYHEIGMDHFALKTDTLYHAFQDRQLHRNFMGYTTNTTKLMIGLGMSAISDSWFAFAQNHKSVREYQESVHNHELPIFRGHVLSEDELEIRRHILNIMCSFQTSWDSTFSNKPFFPEMMGRLEPLVEDGLVSIQDHGLQVTELGQIFVRNICMCFDLHLHENVSHEKRFSKTI